MKKQIRMMTAALLCIVSLFAASCATTKKVSAESPRVGVETTVSSIDKYGNCALGITQDEFTAAGFEPGDVASVKAGAFSFDAPVCTNYSDVDNGKYLIRLSKGAVSFAINMGNFAKTSGAAAGTPVVITMKAKGAYLADYKIRQLKKSENRSDYASDEVFANFREVRMGAIAPNRLYRSCNPVYGDARAPYAEKLIRANGIKAAVNLADSPESASKHIDEAPYYKSLVQDGNVIFLNMGVAFTDEDFIKKLHDGLVFIGEKKSASYVVHCNEGKDRAGYVCALLEALCGATLDEIKADYMMSFENYFGVKKGTEQYDTIGGVIIGTLVSINGGRSVTDRNVGKVVENYLRTKVGLTREEIDAVRAALQ